MEGVIIPPMPKTHKEFPSTLNFGVDLRTKQVLTAIGYMTGQGGEYASPARNFIAKQISVFMDGLSEKERKEFNEILKNVEIQVTK